MVVVPAGVIAPTVALDACAMVSVSPVPTARRAHSGDGVGLLGGARADRNIYDRYDQNRPISNASRTPVNISVRRPDRS
jgi:hypothetical protein